MEPTRRYVTLRITRISVASELLAVAVDPPTDRRSVRGRRRGLPGAPLPMALGLVTLSLVGTPRGRALLAGGAARLLRAATRPRLPPASVRRPAALPPGPA